MQYLLPCGCGRQNRVSRSQAGQSLTCECGETLQVPTLRGLSQLAVATDETIAAASVDRKSWGGWRGSILAAGCAVFVIFLLPCAYYIYVRSQLDTSYTVADEIAAGEANYDAMDMPMLFTDWVNFERNALGPKNKPAFYYIKLFAEENVILASITGGIAGLGGLCALAAWITGPKTSKRER